MSWLKRKKRDEGKKRKVVPVFREAPMVAYVERLDREFEGVKLPQKVGTFEDVHELNELEEDVRYVAGGGLFRAKVYDQRDRHVYLGVHRFHLAGFPLIDSVPVEPRKTTAAQQAPSSKIARLKAETKRLRREAAELKAQDEQEEARRQLALARQKHFSASPSDGPPERLKRPPSAPVRLKGGRHGGRSRTLRKERVKLGTPLPRSATKWTGALKGPRAKRAKTARKPGTKPSFRKRRSPPGRPGGRGGSLLSR